MTEAEEKDLSQQAMHFPKETANSTHPSSASPM